MPDRRRRLVPLIAALSLGTAIAACGSADTGDSAADGTKPTITLAHSVVPVTMDPHTQNDPYQYPFQFFAYDRLTYLDVEGMAQPMLAESWEVAEDGRSLTLHLREGVTFHDGSPMDADAVVANVDRMVNGERSTLRSQLESVQQAVALDEKTVRIDLADASAGALPNIFGGFAGAMVNPAFFDDADTLATIGAGAGPYVVTENKGEGGVTFEPYEDYWDPGVQHAGEIVMKAFPDDETRLSSIVGGDVDGAFIRAPQEERAEQAGLDLVGAMGAYPTVLEINMARSEFDDPLVRQAIAYALDRQEISDAAYAGTCVPSQQLFSEDHWAYADDLGAPYELDRDKARDLLAQAGLPDGFAFELVVLANPTYVTAVEVIQSQLAEVGIDVTITSLPGPEVTQRYWIDRDADAYITLDAFALDPSLVVANYTTPNGFRNVSQYDDPRINDLSAQATATADQADRADLYAQIQQIVLDEALNPLVLCYQRQTWAFKPGVTGFEIGASGLWDFRNLRKDES